MSNLMSLGTCEILYALQAQLTDWLFMLLRETISKFTIDADCLDAICGLSPQEVRKAGPQYFTRYNAFYDRFQIPIIFVLDNGRIIGIDAEGGDSVREPGATNRAWVGHISVCNVHRAVHISRWLYALWVFLDRHKQSKSVSALEAYAKSRPRATPPRHCGCESDPTTPYPSPWPAKRDNVGQDKSAVS